MQKMKKWIALFCAVAALITLLVPINSLAAENDIAVLEENDPAAGVEDGGGDSAEEPPAETPAPGSGKWQIVKGPTGEMVRSTLKDKSGNAVVWVNDSKIEIELAVQGVTDAASYQWTRKLERGEYTVLPTSESAASYFVSASKGDLKQVGTYTYECQPLDKNDEPLDMDPISFTVETKGIGLKYYDAVKSPPSLPAMLVTEDSAQPNSDELNLQVQLDWEEYDAVKGEINVEDSEVAEPSWRGRGVYSWSSQELGSRFDVYPYDDYDFAGAQYDGTDKVASFRLVVAYDQGVKYANQVAAGMNHYTAKAEGAGIDPNNNTVTFERTVIPQLLPSPDSAAAYEAVVDGSAATYTYYTKDLSVSGQLIARWADSLVPGDAQFNWTRTQEGMPPQQTTTSQRALDFTIETPADRTVEFAVAPTGTAFQNASPEQLEQVQAKFTVKVQKDIPDPEITEITAELNNGAPVRITNAPMSSTGAQQVTVARGNDLIFNVEATAGENVGGALKYEWQHLDQSLENGTPITAATAGFELDNEGAQLRISNLQTEADRTWFRITVTNRGGKVAERDIQILLSAPIEPAAKLSSEPEATASMLYLSEGSTFTLLASETNGVSVASLGYQWMQTTAQNYKDESVWTEVKGDSSKANPLSLTAARTLNDVVTYYKCIVTNTSGKGDALQAQTNVIGVQVNPTSGVVTIVEPKQDIYREIDHGSDNRVTFGVEAEIDTNAPIAYQWYMVKATQGEPVQMFETDAIAGATSATYTPGRIPDPGYYVYKCKVYNEQEPTEFAWSPEFQLSVGQASAVPIVSTVGETTLGVEAGGYVRLKVEAYSTSGESLSYQWQRKARNAAAWTDIEDADRPSLTVSNLKTEQSGTQYRCVVKNLRQGVTNESQPYTVMVWRADDMPVILTQPRGWTLQSGTAEAAHPTLKTVVQVTGSERYVFNWERWDATREEWVTPELDQLDVDTDETSSSTLEFPDTDAGNGRYRCQIINKTQNAENATVYTNEVEVRIMMRSVPTVLYAPKSQSAMVGKTVTLRVNAVIHPEEDLIYTWRVQEPNSTSWRNCNDSDGSGYDTPVFITKAYTAADSNETYKYRCVVEGAVNHVQAPEDTTATVRVYPEYPELDPAPTSKLTIKVDEETGERYLRGYVASRDGLVLTVKGVREDVIARNLDNSGGKYTLEVRDKDGNLLKKDDDLVTTGATVTLLLTNEPGSNGAAVPADELTIVILGDIQGSGRMSISQLVMMANYMIGDRDIPAGPQREATDINGNGKCDIGDLTMAAQLLQQVQ